MCFAWKYIFCLSEAPCLAPRLLFFLITYPNIEVTSRLFWSHSVGLCEDFIFLPQLQQIIPVSQWALQLGHCCLEEFSQSSKISVLFCSRFFAELVNLLRLSQILNKRIFILVVLELFDQPLDFVLAYCVLRLDCRKRYSSNSVIHGAVTGFSVTFRVT